MPLINPVVYDFNGAGCLFIGHQYFRAVSLCHQLFILFIRQLKRILKIKI